jgi:UDP-GlcNAc:undecaprenyl-phosphate GlcNAc-1-phosphate transferase
MGDAGSQFLGFSLGVLAVLLTQQTNPGLSMALPALLIGLPIVDILAVFVRRVYLHMNWFRASRNHIHHRLLDLGFTHGQSVVAIYSVQALLVLSALALSYESDSLVAASYLGVCALVFAWISWAERSGWRLARAAVAEQSPSMPGGTWLSTLEQLPLQFVKLTVPLYVIVSGLLIERVPLDFAFAAAGVLGLAGLSLLLKPAGARRVLLRLALYSGVACEVFLLSQNGSYSGSVASSIEIAYFASLGISVAVALRLQHGDGEHNFRTTPLDFLLVIAVIVGGILAAQHVADNGAVAGLIVRLALLFYACELAIAGNRAREAPVQQWSLIGAAVVLLSKTIAFV